MSADDIEERVAVGEQVLSRVVLTRSRPAEVRSRCECHYCHVDDELAILDQRAVLKKSGVKETVKIVLATLKVSDGRSLHQVKQHGAELLGHPERVRGCIAGLTTEVRVSGDQLSVNF